MKTIYQSIFIIASYLLSAVAFAHGNHEVQVANSQQFISGLLHPFSGMDHLLALLFIAILLKKSRLPMIKSVTALITLMAIGAASGLVFGAQGWIEAAILMSLAAMFMLLWIKPVQIQKLVLAVCSLAIITQGWAHAAFASTAALSILHEMQFISGVLVSSLLLLSVFATTASLMMQIRQAQYVR